MSATSHTGGYANSYQQPTAPSTPSSASGGPSLTYAYPGAMSTPVSATGSHNAFPGSGGGMHMTGSAHDGTGSRLGSAAPSAANSPFMSATPAPGPSQSSAGMSESSGAGGVGAPMQVELQRMVQSGRNTPVQKMSPSPAPNTAPPGASGGIAAQGQSMGRSVSMMDMNQWARMSAQQSFMQQQQQQQSSPLGQWAMGMTIPQPGGVQDGTGNPIPRPASSSPTANPHSGFHPSSFGPTPMQLGLNPAQYASGSMASGSSYSGMGGPSGAGFDPGMSMSISPPNWNWAMPGTGGVGPGSYGANGYIAGGNGSFVGSYGGNMMGTSFGRERDRELEARWGREFVCCGNNFGGMHQLLEHYEEQHAKTPADARAAALNAMMGGNAGAAGPNGGFNVQNPQIAAAQAQAQPLQPPTQSHNDVPTPPGMMDIEMEDAPPPPVSAPPPNMSQAGNVRGMMPGLGQGVTANRQIQGGSGNTTPLSATGSVIGRASPLQQQHQPQQVPHPQIGHFPAPPAPGPPISSSALGMHPSFAGGLPLGHSHLMSAPVIGPHGQNMHPNAHNIPQQSPWAAAFRPQTNFASGIQPSLLNMPGMGPIPNQGQPPGPGQGQGQVQGQAMPGQLPQMGMPMQQFGQIPGGQRAITNPAGLSINTNFGLPGAGIAYSHSAPQTPAPSGPSRAGTPSGSRTLSKEELDARAAKRTQKKAAAAAAALSGGHDGEDSDADHAKGEDKKFPCPIEGCGKVYKQANGLKYHLTRSINSGHGNLNVLGSLGYLIGEGGKGEGE